ncbi:MAG: histidine phosphatase family protein [Nocardioidaceae bacterium]
MSSVVLVRHGQASWGADDYDVLSAAGEEQSRALGRLWKQTGFRPDVLICGSLRRQRETLDLVMEAAGFDLEPVVDPGWNEFEFTVTVAEGESFDQVFEDSLDRWYLGGDGFPERFVDFGERVCAAMERTVARTGEGTALVVSSGGPIACVAAGLLGDEPVIWRRLSWVLANTGVCRVVDGRSGRSLLTFNEIAHLSQADITFR